MKIHLLHCTKRHKERKMMKGTYMKKIEERKRSSNI
jgi:hypothetical protein